MKPILIPFSLLILSFLGCVSSRHVENNPGYGYAIVNVRSQTGKAYIRLADGKKMKAFNIYMQSDSTSWTDPGTGNIMTIATQRIYSVSFKNRGRGALEGLGIGFLVGVVWGTVAGYALGDDPPNILYDRMSAGEKSIILGVGLGLFGGVIGLPIGAAIGSREVYYFGPNVKQAEHIARK